ncbi:MAG: preprotein translocase subunit SecE [Alphaproteobacteria bacterium]|jgi:preprotein translocase subunit SecE|nr:preprotein translocase subunit SecE [Alphaproteobacteria bacterium]
MKVKQFSREVRDELNKVTWPERKVAVQTTIMVVILTILIALFFLAVDSFLAFLVNIIF